MKTASKQTVVVDANKLAEKVHPRDIPGMSGKMSAILGCLLYQDWTNPRFVSIITTSDDCLLGQLEGDIGYNEFLGAAEDLRNNIRRLAEATRTRKNCEHHVTKAEEEWLLARF